MYIRNNSISESATDIVDTVRRKCCGKKYYHVPRKNIISEKLFNAQFGKCDWIIKGMDLEIPSDKYLLVSHDRAELDN